MEITVHAVPLGASAAPVAASKKAAKSKQPVQLPARQTRSEVQGSQGEQPVIANTANKRQKLENGAEIKN